MSLITTYLSLLWLSLLFFLQATQETPSRHKPRDRNLEKLARKLEKNFLSLSSPVSTRNGTRGEPPKLDIIFALDASLGSSKDVFEYQKNLTRVLIDGFSIAPSNARVAIVSCASNYVHFNCFLNSYVNKECLVGFIPTSRYQNHGRALGKCLQSVHWQAFVKSHEIRKEAKKVLFIVSTGESPDMTSSKRNWSVANAKKLQSIGVEIYGLSIGAEKNGYKQIQRVVSHPIKDHTFRITNLTSITPLIQLLHGKGQYSSKCKDHITESLYDECGRFCKCKNGHVANCTRIRKFFPLMSQQERFLFINAFRTILTRFDLRRQFKELANTYKKYFTRYIHTRRYFLPWHRAYLLHVENLLRAVDCRVTIPYWDWTLVSGAPWKNNAWNSLRAFEGNGNNGCGGKIKKDHFREGKNSKKNYHSGDRAKRNFLKNTKLPDALIIRLALIIPTKDFEELEILLRVAFHHSVTCRITGMMCSKDNIWSPRYLLLASFIDSLWGKWQQKEPGRWPVGFSDVSDLLPGFPIYTGEVLQLKKQPGCVRVMYDEPKSKLHRKMADIWGDMRNGTDSRHAQRAELIYTKRAEELYGRLTEVERKHFLKILSRV